MTGACVSHAAVELESASQLRKGAMDGTEREGERDEVLSWGRGGFF